MAEEEKYFNQDIDEFTDWIDGSDFKTNSNWTDHKPASGKSIRRLLQGRLRTPIYVHRDNVAGEIRFFSSSKAKALYDSDPETYKELLLGSVPYSSDYSLNLYQDSAHKNVLPSDTYFIKEGDKEANENIFKAYYQLYQAKGDGQTALNVPVYALAVIKDDRTGRELGSVGKNFGSQEQISLNLSDYLQPGINKIEIYITAYINQGTRYTPPSPFTYYIEVVKLSITSDYEFHNSSNSKYVEGIIRVLENTVRSTPQIVINVDGDTNTSSPGNSFPFNKSVDNFSSGLHTLQAIAFVQGSVTGGETVNIYSNIIYTKFIKYNETDNRKDLVFSVSVPSNTSSDSDGNVPFLSEIGQNEFPILNLVQYQETNLYWAFVTTETTANERVVWKLQRYENDEWTDDSILFDAIVTSSKQMSLSLKSLVYGDNYRLIGCIEEYTDGSNANLVTKVTLNLNIKKSSFAVSEKDGYTLKLENVLGYDNNVAEHHRWVSNYKGNNVQCLFNTTDPSIPALKEFPWNSISGWEKGCMHISPGDFIYIPFSFFTQRDGARASGATIEIEFKFKSVSNTNDEVIVIGGGGNNSKLVLTPNKASLYADGDTTPIVYTNYKTDERIKLAFIINKQSGNIDSSDNRLVFIVNNGILERCNSNTGNFSSVGGIQIGNANAGAEVFIYKIRIWDGPISVDEAFQNFAIDSDDIAMVANNNNILEGNNIDYKLASEKLPTIFIDGNPTSIFNLTEDDNISVDLAKFDKRNPDKDMFITECRMRKHGQSTLNYPVNSFKIWSNSNYQARAGGKYTQGYHQASIHDCTIDEYNIPSAEESNSSGFSKNRYQISERSVPSNKWVLQANYADSSGVHNGGIMKLINESWYHALVKIPHTNEEYYKLRTIPQLLTSLEPTRENIDERDFYVTDEDRLAAARGDKKNSMYEYNSDNTVKLWKDLNNGDFPYDIRVAPDSFPCAVFYRPTSNDLPIFLGQYVFMDDKKSDFVYGERSIYKVKGDPFCFLPGNDKQDKKENCLWNNKNCLRIEVVMVNTPLVSYTSDEYLGKGIGEVVRRYKMDPNHDYYVDEYGEPIEESELEEKGVYLDTVPNWCNGFELIYPDIDRNDEDYRDMDDTTFANAINTIAAPFVEFHTWLVSCYNYFISNGGDSSWFYDPTIPNGGASYFSHRCTNDSTIADGNPWYKFIKEAEQHLDLYKLAAYYVFFLKFGLVDSVERNAQLKTYDGKHWHYEPWDMDIAVGNQNTGGLAWNPPMTRRTHSGNNAAYSGMKIANNQVTISNWLWDALESWPTWREDIVPAVADALSQTLTYKHICEVLDEEYAAKWCERLYNLSGHYKYIEAGDGNVYKFLQGSGISHRHWWLKTSLDYYDANWICGEYKNTNAYINIDYNSINPNPNSPSDRNVYFRIGITPANRGYFCYATENGTEGTKISESSKTFIEGGVEGYMQVSEVNLQDKSPFHVYGANNIKKIDFSDVFNAPDHQAGIKVVYFDAYTDNLRSLNIGVPLSLMRRGIYNNKASSTSASLIANNTKGTPLSQRSIEELNIQGARGGEEDDNGNALIPLYDTFLDRTEKLKKLWAIGTVLTSFKSNNYLDEDNEPVYRGGHYEILQLPDTVNSLEFHDSSWVEDNGEDMPENAIGLNFWNYTPDGENSTITKVPFADSNITSLYLYGSTLSNDCAINLLKAFITKAQSDSLENRRNYNLTFEKINITQDYANNHPGFTFTYNDLITLSEMNSGNITGHYKGYICLTDLGVSTEADVLERIQNIRNLFGEDVFSKGTSMNNLVIDFQIGGNDLYIGLGGTAYNVQQDKIVAGYDSNGKANILVVSASRFMLPGERRRQTIKIITEAEKEATSYLGASVRGDDSKEIVIPELKRISSTNRIVPSTFTVKVTDSTVSNTPPISKSITKTLIHKAYPDSINISVIDENNHICLQDITNDGGKVVEVNVATKECTVNISTVYNDSTVDKVTIDDIELSILNNNNRFTITDKQFNKDTGTLVCKLAYDSDVTDLTVDNAAKCNISCKIKYRSGDSLDDFTFNFAFFNDPIIVTSVSNEHLHSALDKLGIPCPIDNDTNYKIYTESALKKIEQLNFYSSNQQDAAVFGGIGTFNVDTSDSSKGTIFNYLNPDILTSIDLRSCTGLSGYTLNIDLSSFSVLTSLNTGNINTNFTYNPSSTQNLHTVVIGNAGAIKIYNIKDADNITITNAGSLDLNKIEFTDEGISNITVDYNTLNATNNYKLWIREVSTIKGGSIISYLKNYILSVNNGATMPRLASMRFKWENFEYVAIDDLDLVKKYIDRYEDTINSNLFFDGGTIKTSNYYQRVKETIYNYYPLLVANWGELSVQIDPIALRNFISNALGSGVAITKSTLYSVKKRGNPYPARDILKDFYESAGYSSINSADVTNLLWLLYTNGSGSNGRDTNTFSQQDHFDTWYPNVTYIGWPKDNNSRFKAAQHSGLKAKAIVTTSLHFPYHNNNYSFDLYYKVIIISEEAVDNWYDELVTLTNFSLITPGKTNLGDKADELKKYHIHCKVGNISFTNEEALKNITENQIDAIIDDDEYTGGTRIIIKQSASDSTAPATDDQVEFDPTLFL